MACFFACDNCGKREPGRLNDWHWHPPRCWHTWGSLAKNKLYHACCGVCAQAIAEKYRDKEGKKTDEYIPRL